MLTLWFYPAGNWPWRTMARNKAIISISFQLHNTFLGQERFIVLSTDGPQGNPRPHRGRANIFCPVHMREVELTHSKGYLSFQAQCQNRCFAPILNSRLTIIYPYVRFFEIESQAIWGIDLPKYAHMTSSSTERAFVLHTSKEAKVEAHSNEPCVVLVLRTWRGWGGAARDQGFISFVFL